MMLSMENTEDGLRVNYEGSVHELSKLLINVSNTDDFVKRIVLVSSDVIREMDEEENANLN